METLKDFSKLYGRVNGTLAANTNYRIKIKFVYDSHALDTNKILVLAEIG